MDKVDIGKPKNPAILIIASIMYMLPAFVFFYFTLMNSINVHKNFFSICIEWYPTTILAVYHLLIGIGLLFRNVVAWWGTFIGPLPILYGTIYLAIISFSTYDSDMSPGFAMMGTFFSIVIIIYYGNIIRLITNHDVRTLFKSENRFTKFQKFIRCILMYVIPLSSILCFLAIYLYDNLKGFITSSHSYFVLAYMILFHLMIGIIVYKKIYIFGIISYYKFL